MKTNIINLKGRSIGMELLTGILATGLLLGLTACRSTHQVRGTPEESGFLKDYSLLQKGKSGQARLVYIDPAADWTQYTKICLQPVELWNSDDPKSKLGKLDKEDQQTLVNYAHASMREAFAKTKFQIVDNAGPGVLVIRAAITEAKKSRPVSNLASTVVPFGMALSLAKRVVFGTGLAVGECQGEVEILDGVTGKRVAAAVDRRAGTKALRTKFNTTLGDVKLSLDYWSEQMATRLTELQAGKKSGDL